MRRVLLLRYTHTGRHTVGYTQYTHREAYREAGAPTNTHREAYREA